MSAGENANATVFNRTHVAQKSAEDLQKFSVLLHRQFHKFEICNAYLRTPSFESYNFTSTERTVYKSNENETEIYVQCHGREISHLRF